MARRIWTTVLIALPLAMVALWLAGGREIFTKSGKAIDVAEYDELFGETFVRRQFVPGPVAGYYIGLDLVILVAGVCLAAWAIARLMMRRHRHKPGQGGTL